MLPQILQKVILMKSAHLKDFYNPKFRYPAVYSPIFFANLEILLNMCVIDIGKI